MARVRVERVLASSSFLRVLETGSNLRVEAGDLVELPGLGTGATAVGGTVSDLLERATLQVMENKLTSPAGDNAYETLSAVLAREPGNAHAQSLLGDIADQYVSWGEAALGQGELERALSQVAKATRVRPGHAGALALRGRVEAVVAERANAAEEARRAREVADALARANGALDRGDAKAAREAVSAARALDPNAPGIAGTEEGLRQLEREGVVNSVGMRMRRISAGSFTMGSPVASRARREDEFKHQVTLSRDYLLSTTEVTQDQWASVMGVNPSYFKGEDLPVEQVSWFDAVRFCNELSRLEGLAPAYWIQGDSVAWNQSSTGYRLPSEAEWEHACRAGTSAPYHFGETITPEQVNCNLAHLAAGGGSNRRYRRKTTPAGSLPPNAWGIHEMAGNVWEWCWDWYDVYPAQSVADYDGPRSGTRRVIRGGSWISHAEDCRSARRVPNSPSYRHRGLGLRVARSLPKTTALLTEARRHPAAFRQNRAVSVSPSRPCLNSLRITLGSLFAWLHPKIGGSGGSSNLPRSAIRSSGAGSRGQNSSLPFVVATRPQRSPDSAPAFNMRGQMVNGWRQSSKSGSRRSPFPGPYSGAVATFLILWPVNYRWTGGRHCWFQFIASP